LKHAKRVPLGIGKYPCQQVPGTANFGIATWPPFFKIAPAVTSNSVTFIEHTYAFVPLCGGGGGAGRFSNSSACISKNAGLFMRSLNLAKFSRGP